jgi:hypothetical protein
MVDRLPRALARKDILTGQFQIGLTAMIYQNAVSGKSPADHLGVGQLYLAVDRFFSPKPKPGCTWHAR